MKHKCLFAAMAALFSFGIEAEETISPLLQYIAEQSKTKNITLSINIGSREVQARVTGSGDNGLKVSAQGASFELSWKKIAEQDAFVVFRTAVAGAPGPVRSALLLDGIHRGHARDPEFRQMFEALCRDDIQSAHYVQHALDAFTGTKPSAPKEGGAGGDSRSIGFSSNATEPSPGVFRDRIVSRDGKIDRAAYVAQATSGDAEYFSNRFGPDWTFYHKNIKDDAPEIFLRHDDGEYIHKERGKKPVDWTGMGGQCLYVPQSPRDPGMDRMMFCWSFHEEHGPAKFWHVYRLRPARSAKDGGEWWAESPDPLLKQPAFAKPAQGVARFPVSVARGHVEWSNNGIIAFSNGQIAATGSGNNGDRYPVTQLPPGLVPTAVALTNNNEFALVTAWDVQNLKGKLAVIAMQYDRGYPEKTTVPIWCLPSNGYYSGLKVLGVIDLPFAAPSSVAAACDLSLWKWVLDGPNDLDFSNASNRDKWAAATGGSQSAGRAGFAVVISRAENKVAFVDLAPLFQYVRKMYFGSAESAAKTKDIGPAPGQWPYTFDVAPEARPRVIQTLEVPQPTCVAAGYADSSAKGFESKAFVGTLDGKLAVYDVGSLITPNVMSGIKLVASAQIGRNPTCIALGRSAQPRDTLIIVCRGEKEIQWVKVGTTSAKVVRHLRDKRLVDPVWAEISDTRGAWVVSVADFKGSKIVNYITAPIDSWGDELFGKLGPDGKVEFECTGVQNMPGYPFMISGAEVP